MSTELEHWLYTLEDGVLTIAVNRPQVLNALNVQVIDELDRILDDAAQNTSIHVLILTGSGERAFVAGADIAQMQKMDVLQARTFAQKGSRTFTKLQRLPKPSIAAVQGYALGGGCELALCCDIRIAADTAQFGQPEVNLGIIPGFGGTQRLTRLVGIGAAKELLFTGDRIDAQRAFAIGLVNRVTEPAELMPTARRIAKQISAKSAYSIALCKQAVDEGISMDLDRALLYETELFSLSFGSPDQREGMTAFLEKRKPNFN
ncbi:MAG: crotonase [Bacilli bacterium]|nr:crotonase [Bacilli bacterium]